MKYLYLSIFTIALLACSESTPIEKSPDTFDNSFNISEGDSIPLQDAIDMFDSQFTGEDLSSDSSRIELKNNLHSLKVELSLDPKNEYLKTQIEELESSLRLIEFVEKDIVRRDSIIEAMVHGGDTAIAK